MRRIIKLDFFKLTMLFASKSAGALVALIAMPLYYELLGSEQFGIVAVILSLQALLVMLDLGMSTAVGRDVSILGAGSDKSISVWRNGEVVLTFFYIGLGIIVLMSAVLGAIPHLSIYIALGITGLFWSLVLQNLGQVVLLSSKAFNTASGIQFFGAISRAVLTVTALKIFQPTLAVFIVAQLASAIIQLFVTRYLCLTALCAGRTASKKQGFDLAGCIDLIGRSKSLILFGLAGAAVMQLDKPIIAFYISASDVSTYYLAVTYCMLPISLLAGPVSQYFQPQLMALVTNGYKPEGIRMLHKFVFFLILITTLSSSTLWANRNFWIELWLHKAPSSTLIGDYVEILLPAVVIGAFGYIPYALLVAHQDYKIQSVLSMAISGITLLLVLYFAADKNVFAICWVYAGYHICSTLISWIRAITIGEIRKYGIESLLFSLKLFTFLFLIIWVASYLLNYFIVEVYLPILFIIIMIILGLVTTTFFIKLKLNKIL
jgi:O-antigen/teichoic acid export membrane protein